MVRRTAVTLTAAAIGLVGLACGTSSVPNDAEVTVAGTLRLPDGTPAGDVTVMLVERPSGLSALFETALLLGSFGTLCLAGDLTICDDARTTTTDQDGRYAFTMSGQDSKNVFGNPSGFVLTAALSPPDGYATAASVQAGFKIDREEIAVPELRFWEAEPLAVSAGAAWIEYSAPGPKAAEPPSYAAVVSDGEHVVWEQPGEVVGRIDARAVADASAVLHLTAGWERRADGVDFAVTYHSQGVGFQGKLGQPASRGAGCDQGEPAQPVPDPCPITDGQYAQALTFASELSCPQDSPSGAPAASPSPGSCLPNGWLSVDLGSPSRVGTVFVHGLQALAVDGLVAIEVSDDAESWTELGFDQLASYDQFDLPEPVTVRYVRLRVAEVGIIDALAELSVWP